jgi:hypothetical protein
VCWKSCSSCWSLYLLREEFLSAPIHSPSLVRHFGFEGVERLRRQAKGEAPRRQQQQWRTEMVSTRREKRGPFYRRESEERGSNALRMKGVRAREEIGRRRRDVGGRPADRGVAGLSGAARARCMWRDGIPLAIWPCGGAQHDVVGVLAVPTVGAAAAWRRMPPAARHAQRQSARSRCQSAGFVWSSCVPAIQTPIF